MRCSRGRIICVLALGATLAGAQVRVPAGTPLEIRVETPVNSRTSKPGDAVTGVLIAPAVVDGQAAIPVRSRLLGSVVSARKLGLGLFRSRAQLELRFHTLELPAGEAFPVETKLLAVDTARERVDAAGRIQGTRAAFNIPAPLAVYAWRLLWLEPLVAAPVWATKFVFAPAPDSEVRFPAGTEMTLALEAPLEVPSGWPASNPPPDPQARAAAAAALSGLPVQWTERVNGRRGDLVNIVLLGSRAEVESAFGAAGWTGADRRNWRSAFLSFRAVLRRGPYQRAPMSPFLLDGAAPKLEFQKSLNTFARRHHVRLWERTPGVWAGAAVEDTGFRFSWKRFHWTHSTDPAIDRERAKLFHDLQFTGCSAAGGLVDRDLETPAHMDTDGRVAVLPLAVCPPAAPALPAGRRRLAAFRDDAIRSNFLSLTSQAARLGAFTAHRVWSWLRSSERSCAGTASSTCTTSPRE